MFKNKKGFTLIELLVVIAIIGILASIVLVSLNSAREKARDVRRVSDMRQIALALEMYYDESSNVYPTDSTPGATCNGWGDMKTALEGGGYMTAVPSDPGGSAAYAYEVKDSNRQGYVLRAQMESQTQSSLVSDVDGASVFGCNCEDLDGASTPADTNRYYCIQP